MIVNAACCTNVGYVRLNNEDNFYFDGIFIGENENVLSKSLHYSSSKNEQIFAVFDGMGGEICGEYASFIAAKTLSDDVADQNDKFTIHEIVITSLMKSNKLICDKMEQEKISRMGSTAAIIAFDDDKLIAANIGDSRIYKFSNGEFSQLSRDHTDRKIHDLVLPNANINKKYKLTQHLGIFPNELIIEPYISESEFNTGDKYLVCSDGLTDMLSDDEICSIISMPDPVGNICEKIVSTALKAGGKDNVTVIICEIPRKNIVHKKRSIKAAVLVSIIIFTICITAYGLFVVCGNNQKESTNNSTNDTTNQRLISITGLVLNSNELSIRTNDIATLTYIIDPSNATNVILIWESSNASVAAVDNGRITAKKKGVAVITVSTEDGSLSYPCTVTVY